MSVDERMIPWKGRSTLKQYMPDKPTKWGIKLFAACDVATSYLFNLEVYTGALPGQGEVGLTQAVVTRMMQAHQQQQYVVYTDNFYTSPSLADALTAQSIGLVGTLRLNRVGVPDALKDSKTYEKDAARGDARYVRVNNKVFIQWKDKRVVTVLSTYHKGSAFVEINRNTKQGGQHAVLTIRQPKAISDYNHGMGGVDTFDSRCAAYKVRRKSRKYWKALFYDFLEIASVNSFILFREYCRLHPDAVPRSATYDHEEFRVQLTRQLGGLNADSPVPLYRQPGAAAEVKEAAKSHMPVFRGGRHNCRYCYEFERVERKATVFCPTCQVYLHVTARNCFERWHARKL